MRKMVMLAMLGAVAVTATACVGPTQFVNERGSPQTFDVDRQQCAYEAQLHQPNDPFMWPDTVRQCLYARGWKPVR